MAAPKLANSGEKMNQTSSSVIVEPIEQKPKTSKIPKMIWTMGCMMFLINASCVMVFSVLPTYLRSIGVSIAFIGMLEGIAEGASYSLKVLSGVISDYFRRRKIFMIIGYSMTVIAKPILALSSTFAIAFGGKLLERFGNGIQASPRDALVSDIAPADRKGTCFGVKRSLGVAGSFFGSALGVFVMVWTYNNYHQLFWIATIPAVMALLLLIIKIKDPQKLGEQPESTNENKEKRRQIRWSDLPLLGKSYWLLMITVALFMSARVGESMLILHANESFGLPQEFAPFVVMLYNTTYSLSSYPMGKLADRKNRSALLAFGILALMLADFLLFSASNIYTVFMGVIFWGVQMGAVQAVFMAMVAQMAPKELRGTAFGIFYLVCAISSLIAGTLAGIIADKIDISASFYYSFLMAGLAILSVFLLNPGKKRPVAVAIN